MGHRVLVLMVAVSVISLAIVQGFATRSVAIAQEDDVDATVSALQTQVAAQQTEVARLQTSTAATATATATTPSTADAENGTPTSELPEGIPAGAEKGEVESHVDGDTIAIRTQRGVKTIELLGVDAPNFVGDRQAGGSHCFASESADHLARMLPKGRDVYLEIDDGPTSTPDDTRRFV